ncbi:Histidine decarboxylase [Orchesella cincta]|uniref:Histidine decarboxylase n=1 Tax=Orchesella cincta TaxID=48709 RepID=A0A1D2MEE2_ORCCI|nr:Histidine decarboxylase [Orchesella cincta]
MLADAINCLGFTWASSPACTELETIVMDWLGKMIGLPPAFLHSSNETLGGGVIQTTASESTFIALMAGRSEAIRRCKTQYPELSSSEINARLVAYCSDQHWQIALSKRFRALKLWFVLRSFGVQGLQEHIRKSVRLAARFEAMVAADSRFEISAKRHLGLVVFRLRGDNELTETLLKRLNASGKIHCVPASLKGRYVIRFTITSPQTTVEDICTDWAVVKETARAVLSNEEVRDIPMVPARKVPLAETRLRNAHFGTSLLLANSPMSPKIVNGSFAAIFDSNELFKEFERKLKLSEMDNSSPGTIV